MPTPTEQFRNLLSEGQTIVAPGVFDPLTARLAVAAGFPAVYLGGFSLGAQACITEPLMTLTELVDVSRAVTRAVDVPVIVDAAGGFGDVPHTQRTVRELEGAGVAAIHIEDEVIPKMARAHEGKFSVLPIEDIARKIKAAVDAKTDPDFVIIARTDVLRLRQSVESAVERCTAYQEVGADMIFVSGATLEQASEVSRAVSGMPYVLLSGSYGPDLGLAGYDPDRSRDDMEAAGCSLLLYPMLTTLLLIQTLEMKFPEIRERGQHGMSDEEIQSLRETAYAMGGMRDLQKLEAVSQSWNSVEA